jgi:hypothetical protein
MILGLLLLLAILWALAERRRANKLSETVEELENERDEHVCEPARDEWNEKIARDTEAILAACPRLTREEARVTAIMDAHPPRMER